MTFLQLSKDSPWMQKSYLEKVEEEEEEREENENQILQQRVTEWAQDLKTVSEVRVFSCSPHCVPNVSTLYLLYKPSIRVTM